MTEKQPTALWLADEWDTRNKYGHSEHFVATSKELRRQHARIVELEATFALREQEHRGWHGGLVRDNDKLRELLENAEARIVELVALLAQPAPLATQIQESKLLVAHNRAGT